MLGDALCLLQEQDPIGPVDRYVIEYLRPIIRRFKRNERRLDDLTRLRELRALVREEYGDRNPYQRYDSYEAEVWAQFGKVPIWIEKALRGAAAPTLVT